VNSHEAHKIYEGHLLNWQVNKPSPDYQGLQSCSITGL
jgi:hypothetical protein